MVLFFSRAIPKPNPLELADPPPLPPWFHPISFSSWVHAPARALCFGRERKLASVGRANFPLASSSCPIHLLPLVLPQLCGGEAPIWLSGQTATATKQRAGGPRGQRGRTAKTQGAKGVGKRGRHPSLPSSSADWASCPPLTKALGPSICRCPPFPFLWLLWSFFASALCR
jgi:hypothetical protein